MYPSPDVRKWHNYNPVNATRLDLLTTGVSESMAMPSTTVQQPCSAAPIFCTGTAYAQHINTIPLLIHSSSGLQQQVCSRVLAQGLGFQGTHCGYQQAAVASAAAAAAAARCLTLWLLQFDKVLHFCSNRPWVPTGPWRHHPAPCCHSGFEAMCSCVTSPVPPFPAVLAQTLAPGPAARRRHLPSPPTCPRTPSPSAVVPVVAAVASSTATQQQQQHNSNSSSTTAEAPNAKV
jgi:hypothetical protein